MPKLADQFRLAKDYLRFRLVARSRFSIHSPFLFELVNDVFRDQRYFYAFDDIRRIRHELLYDSRSINENHFGEPSKRLSSQSRQVSEVARVTAIPDRYGKMLFRLVTYLRPANILEMGTGLGISALYLASAESSAPFITLEGSPSLSKIAQVQFLKLQLKNVKVLEGNFNDTLPEAVQKIGKLHFVFIDGDHKKDALINYIRQILPHLAKDATIVVDDIYWSEEMKSVWREIICLPQVTLSIDLFRMGILFFREGMVKQDLKVVTY